MFQAWAIVAHFLLLDFPSNTKKFTAAERALAQSRLQADSIETRAEDTPRITSWRALCTSITDWRTWLFVLGYMIIVGSSTLTYFYPGLVKDLGYTSHMAQYMVVPIYAVSFVAVVATGYFMDKIPRHRGLVIAGWLGLSFICSVCVCTIYNPTARYVLLIFLASGLWASNGLSLSYAASTFGAMPQEVRGVSLAIVNAMGNAAQIHGAYLFPSEDGPKVSTVYYCSCSSRLTFLLVSHGIWRYQRYVRIWDCHICSITLSAEEVPSKKQCRSASRRGGSMKPCSLGLISNRVVKTLFLFVIMFEHDLVRYSLPVARM